MYFLDLPTIVDEALNATCLDFVETVDRAALLLRQEHGKKGNLDVTDRLVKLEPHGEALIIGDLHGDFESLVTILQKSRFIEKMKKKLNATIIFLGDYGDRGEKSAETYYAVLKLKIEFPEQVVLLRGNHEGPVDLLAYPHDLPYQFQDRFKKDWDIAYKKTQNLWSHLYNAVYIENRYLILHGGLSKKIHKLADIAEAQEKHDEALLEDLLWSDPDENVPTLAPSPRGAGKLFGKTITKKVLGELNAKILIRGHESSDSGFKINHDGRVLTLFSRKGAPYFNETGAYLQLPLEMEIQNAEQLIPWIQKF